MSQNVSYTSAIILKRAVKAKLDLGILLMCLVYMPVLFTLVQSVTSKSSDSRHLSHLCLMCPFVAYCDTLVLCLQS